MASRAAASKNKAEVKPVEQKHVGPVHLKEYQDLKGLLRNAKAGNENNLYEHIVEVMNHIIVHSPEEALNNLEEISFLLKNENRETFNMEQFLNLESVKKYSQHNPEVLAFSEQVLDSCSKKFVSSSADDAADEEAEDGGNGSGPIGYIPDLI
eukprot:CAMPEP_0176367080 /NCGR_PEP_ID=MMETSP0126-20121128/21624_1 /TAXON_ID=141414 ORGANISM="Strombidinopsis acuminatum, Strain SPMC142" /NCGR_SAMPLE_ID=MMETSP0126 /ASSEMBLY_ACC=CAM_ASM_000229 /LENGTH=152 /DNA_ID=CAMNT_0017724747 /DNA_START=11 /DNA_END=469 /DNA_ORIENTATION=-